MKLKHVSVSSILAIAAVTAPSAFAQLTQNNVSPAVRLASDLGPVDRSQPLTVTVHLKLQNEAAFQKTLDALYDPASPSYHHWLSDAELKKFAPTQQQVEAVKQQLRASGLTILSTDENNFSIRARGTTGAAENAFNTQIHQFQRSGKTFQANVQTARLGGAAANYVSAVSGLESHEAHPLIKHAIDLKTGKPYASIPLTKVKASGGGLSSYITNQILSAPASFTFTTSGEALPVGIYYGNVYGKNPNLVPDYTAAQLQQAYGLTDAYKKGLNGKGQTIVLLEAYGYPTIEADANAFSQLNGLPQLNSSNFSIVYPEGKPNPNAGILTGWDGEIALDVQWAHAIAPNAKIVVVAAAGQDNEDFQDAIQYIVNHKLGYTVSNSWEVDTDLIAGPLEQQSFDRVLALGAAKGVSFQFSTGDGGDGGLGSPVGAAGVPSVSPNATAVGGTAIFNKVGASGTQTLGWGDTFTFLASGGPLDPPELYGLAGGAGGGESTYFPKPSWQKSLPGTGRQTPDVSALADPYTGVPIVITSGGQQQIQVGIGGTSLASPIFTAIWAIADQKAGHPLGQAARSIAAAKSSVQDVLPLSSPTNVSGAVIDKSGTTAYSASALFSGALYTTTGFTSAVWDEGEDTYLDAGFGIDSSLTVTPGWDNVTGYGTPYGLAFFNAVAK